MKSATVINAFERFKQINLEVLLIDNQPIFFFVIIIAEVLGIVHEGIRVVFYNIRGKF